MSNYPKTSYANYKLEGKEDISLSEWEIGFNYLSQFILEYKTIQLFFKNIYYCVSTDCFFFLIPIYAYDVFCFTF